MSSPRCTCHAVEKPWTYYGIVEPGGALEPNPDCPAHFPAAARTPTVLRNIARAMRSGTMTPERLESIAYDMES